MSASLVNQLIAAADALPAHLRDWIVDGFTKWQQGQSLESALGLDDSDTPGVDLDERDRMLVHCIRSAPASSQAARIEFFLQCMSAQIDHPDDTAARFIHLMKSSSVRIPETLRHLRRIMDGRRSDGWRVHGTSRWHCVPKNPSATMAVHSPEIVKNGMGRLERGTTAGATG